MMLKNKLQHYIKASYVSFLNNNNIGNTNTGVLDNNGLSINIELDRESIETKPLASLLETLHTPPYPHPVNNTVYKKLQIDITSTPGLLF